MSSGQQRCERTERLTLKNIKQHRCVCEMCDEHVVDSRDVTGVLMLRSNICSQRQSRAHIMEGFSGRFSYHRNEDMITLFGRLCDLCKSILTGYKCWWFGSEQWVFLRTHFLPFLWQQNHKNVFVFLGRGPVEVRPSLSTIIMNTTEKLFQEVEGEWKGVKSRLGRAGEVNVEMKGEGAGVAQKRDSKSVEPSVRIL